MTLADYGRFSACMRDLGVTLNEPTPPDRIEQYFHALIGFDVNELVAAAEQVKCTAHWFPKPIEWREAVDAIRVAALKTAIRPARDEPWHFECPACEDTERIHYYCEKGDPPCDRKDPKPCATCNKVYVRDCQCKGRNTTVQRRRAHAPKAEKSSSVRRGPASWRRVADSGSDA
jgi:hypothetical protein